MEKLANVVLHNDECEQVEEDVVVFGIANDNWQGVGNCEQITTELRADIEDMKGTVDTHSTNIGTIVNNHEDVMRRLAIAEKTAKAREGASCS